MSGTFFMKTKSSTFVIIPKNVTLVWKAKLLTWKLKIELQSLELGIELLQLKLKDMKLNLLAKLFLWKVKNPLLWLVLKSLQCNIGVESWTFEMKFPNIFWCWMLKVERFDETLALSFQNEISWLNLKVVSLKLNFCNKNLKWLEISTLETKAINWTFLKETQSPTFVNIPQKFNFWNECWKLNYWDENSKCNIGIEI